MIAPVFPTEPVEDLADRLLRLLPPVVQIGDAFAGQSLRALLRILREQGRLVEDDISRLLDNWFVETCDDWVLPYLGELVGYRLVPELTQALAAGRRRDGTHALVPRLEVADTVRFRRRKGSLLLLEEIARAASGWPARAVEVRTLIAAVPHARFPELAGPAFANARPLDVLDRGHGPFSALPRRPDARRLSAPRVSGRGSVNSIALHVWRLRPFLVQFGRACHRCPDQVPLPSGVAYRYTFDPFGDDRQLFHAPGNAAPRPTSSAGEMDVPGPIRRRAFRTSPESYYGPPGGSICVWLKIEPHDRKEVQLQDVIPANLTDWERGLPSELKEGQIAIDPQLGRLMTFRQKSGSTPEVWVRYHTGFSTDIGGGTRRILSKKADVEHWRVGGAAALTLGEALKKWEDMLSPRRVVIELQDDLTHDLGEYPQQQQTIPERTTRLGRGDYLEIRGSAGRRPALKLHRQACETHQCWRILSEADDAVVVLDGLVVGGPTMRDRVSFSTQSIQQQASPFMGLELRFAGTFREARLRHVTLTPGRTRLVLDNSKGCFSVERSLLASIAVTEDTRAEPPKLFLTDSIVDGAASNQAAIAALAPGPEKAFLALTAERVTMLGPVHVYSVLLAQDSIFEDKLAVTRTEIGCIRFCILSHDTNENETPPRYRSPRDERAGQRLVRKDHGDAAYGQLVPGCPVNLVQSAEDGSEPGALHDLYQPQREALLRARLAEYTLAGSDAQLFFAT